MQLQSLKKKKNSRGIYSGEKNFAVKLFSTAISKTIVKTSWVEVRYLKNKVMQSLDIPTETGGNYCKYIDLTPQKSTFKSFQVSWKFDFF